MFFFWYLWKFLFFFVRLDLFVWRIFAKIYFNKSLKFKSFQFRKLPYLDRCLIAMFHTQYNYLLNDFIFDDKYKILKYRLYNHSLLYIYMSYYSYYRSNYLINQSIVKVAFLTQLTRFSFYLSPLGLEYKSDRFRRFFELNLLMHRYYYRYYTYYMFNRHNINGWAPRYKKAENLFFLFLILVSLNMFDEATSYTIYKINDFYEYLHTEETLVSVNLRLYKQPRNWLYDRLLLLKQQTYYRYHTLYMYWFNTPFTFREDIIGLPINIPNKARYYFKVSELWVANLKKKFPIKFSVSNLVHNIKYKSLKNFVIYYIRKNKIFNKGRYSRNRQQYRTGFYWCLWLNIMVVYGLYFFFYRFAFTFGYLGLGLIILALSFVFARACQSKFYNPVNLWLELNALFVWFSYLVILVSKLLYNLIQAGLDYSLLLFYSDKSKSNYINSVFLENFFKCVYFLQYNTQLKRYEHFYYIWIPFQGEDTSFLKWRSIVHWFTQLYLMLRS